MPACGEVSTHNPNAYIQYMPTACLQTPRASANTYTASSGIGDLNRERLSCNRLINRPPWVPQTNINPNHICQQRLLIRIRCITYMNNLCPPKQARGVPWSSHQRDIKISKRGRGITKHENTQKTKILYYTVFYPSFGKNMLWLYHKCNHNKEVTFAFLYVIKKKFSLITAVISLIDKTK